MAAATGEHMLMLIKLLIKHVTHHLRDSIRIKMQWEGYCVYFYLFWGGGGQIFWDDSDFF